MLSASSLTLSPSGRAGSFSIGLYGSAFGLQITAILTAGTVRSMAGEPPSEWPEVDILSASSFCWISEDRRLLFPSEEAHGQEAEHHRPAGHDQERLRRGEYALHRALQRVHRGTRWRPVADVPEHGCHPFLRQPQASEEEQGIQEQLSDGAGPARRPRDGRHPQPDSEHGGD